MPPSWDAAGIHGLQRGREWDAVATLSAPDLPGERVEFVALAPGELVVLGEGSAGPLAADNAYRAAAGLPPRDAYSPEYTPEP